MGRVWTYTTIGTPASEKGDESVDVDDVFVEDVFDGDKHVLAVEDVSFELHSGLTH
jgi:hypothetical protein